MHDHPGIYPTLPGREPDPESWRLMVEPSRGTPFETCWEYVLTHQLTQAEGAAFWTAANLVHKAMGGQQP
jgi:hypothetical protein